MERTVLYTNEGAFQNAIDEYAEKKQLQSKIKDEVKKLLNIKIKSDFFDDIELNFFNEIEKAYPKYKELNIKATKIPELIDMDTSKLKSLTEAYHRKNRSGITVKDVKNPSISEFQVLAETDEEIRKHKVALRFIEAAKELESAFDMDLFVGDLARATKGILNANMRDGKGAQALRFNHRKILEQRRELKRELV